MGEQTYRSVTVPEYGEDLIESIRAMSESTISVTTCDSVAEADLIADTAISGYPARTRRRSVLSDRRPLASRFAGPDRRRANQRERSSK